MKRTSENQSTDNDESVIPLFVNDVFKRIVCYLTEPELHIWRFVSKLAKKSVTDIVLHDPEGDYLKRFAQVMKDSTGRDYSPHLFVKGGPNENRFLYDHDWSYRKDYPISWQIMLAVDQFKKSPVQGPETSPLLLWLKTLFPLYLSEFNETIHGLPQAYYSSQHDKQHKRDYWLSMVRCNQIFVEAPGLLAYCFSDPATIHGMIQFFVIGFEAFSLERQPL